MSWLRILLPLLALAGMACGSANARANLAGDFFASPETVVMRNSTLTLRGLLFRPAGRGPFPAVLYNHGSGPQSDARRPSILGPVFARHGYITLYLFRRGAGLSADQGTDSERLMNRALAQHGQEGRNALQLQLHDIELGDVLAGVEFLRARRDVDASRLAVVGHSFGGQLSLLLAERDERVRATVVFSPAGGSWDTSPILRSRLRAAVGRIKTPVFFIHAANDFSVEPGKTLSAEMARLGKSQSIKIYPAVGKTAAEGHDFVHIGVATWEADVVAFLHEHLRP